MHVCISPRVPIVVNDVFVNTDDSDSDVYIIRLNLNVYTVPLFVKIIWRSFMPYSLFQRIVLFRSLSWVFQNLTMTMLHMCISPRVSIVINDVCEYLLFGIRCLYN